MNERKNIPIPTACNEIDLAAWTKVGEGGNGAVYTNGNEPGVILKLSFQESGTLPAVAKEFYTSKAVYDLGVPTPQMIDIVRVGSNYGIKSRLVGNKKSLARICGEDPPRIKEMAAVMAELGKRLHSTEVMTLDMAGGGEWLPSMKALMLQALASTNMLGGKKLQEVTAFVGSLEDAPTLLHGDFNLGNLIFSMPGETPYWIDLGRAAHGLPMFDLGHLYLFCNIFSKKKRVQEITHMTEGQMLRFWSAFALAYNGAGGLDRFTAECRRFAALDVLLLGYIQPLSLLERMALGLIAKSMFR
ncbi:MAG: phosphotransferase [Paludibacteraceae bacterium]|nr:phosphotransferase [Paludibacteraceae bacterium]